ncbi:MAG: YkgJ family cysteine cluster protein [Magnetococcus sp. WYHC-3]
MVNDGGVAVPLDLTPVESAALAELDAEFGDDPDYQALGPAGRVRLVRVMERMLEWGIGAIYGDEPQGVPDAPVACERMLPLCHAHCCRFHFALTREEAAGGRFRHRPDRPFFLAKGDDGQCVHLDRDTNTCAVWEHRPLRCRRYDCTLDPEFRAALDGMPQSGILAG